MPTVGDRIRRLRRGLDLSQGALARKLHVTNATISGWERNESRPKPEHAKILVALGGQTLDWLWGAPVTSVPSAVHNPATATPSGDDVEPVIDLSGLPHEISTWLGAGRELWRVKSRALDQLGFMPGALIVVDKHAQIKSGNKVLAKRTVVGQTQ